MKSKISLRKKKGFTLMEMLIVVAIIAILIAIAIPIFNSQLEKAREATDDANLRSAKSLAVATYLTEDITTATTYYFDAESGTLVKTVPTAYGKGTTGGDYDKAHTNQYISVIFTPANGTVAIQWGTTACTATVAHESYFIAYD